MRCNAIETDVASKTDIPSMNYRLDRIKQQLKELPDQGVEKSVESQRIKEERREDSLIKDFMLPVLIGVAIFTALIHL